MINARIKIHIVQKYIKLLSNQALWNNAKVSIPIVAQSQNKNRHKADFNFVVGVTGIEPATPCTPCKYSTRLSYTPTMCVILVYVD